MNPFIKKITKHPVFYFAIIIVLGISTNLFLILQDAESVNVKDLEWRLPAEVEYFLILEDFFKKRLTVDATFAGDPKQLEVEKAKLTKEENRLVQHILDLHGFDRTFLGGFAKRERGLRKTLLAKDPELFRKERIPVLKSMIASGPEALKVLEQQKPEAADEVKREIEQFKVELAELELEEERFNFPPPKNELETFPQMEREWWELKKDFFRNFFKLPVKSEEFRKLRWDLVQEYREKLSTLMRSKRVKPVHYQEYQQRKPLAFKEYIQKHPEHQNWWNQLGRILAIQTPGFSLEQSSGMAMIVGSIVECSVPPPQCRGEQINTSRPLSGMEMTVMQTEGELTWQDVPSGGQLLLPPTYRTISDQQGRFSFPSLPLGKYFLSGELWSTENKEKRYRSLVRKLFIDGSHEVLIIDLPAERLKIGSVE